MFTGIVTNQAVLREKKKVEPGVRFTFEILGQSSPFQLGQSVALDGVCVTVASFRRKKFSGTLIEDTLRSTTLGQLSLGERVNLERALRAGDEVGGHWVTGHVDGVGVIRKIERKGKGLRFEISAPADIIHRFIEKGSVAIDGISFTLQAIRRGSFRVGVTPHTFRATTLPWKREGDRVNLETDLFAKLVEHSVSNSKGKSSSLRLKALQKQGF